MLSRLALLAPCQTPMFRPPDLDHAHRQIVARGRGRLRLSRSGYDGDGGLARSCRCGMRLRVPRPPGSLPARPGRGSACGNAPPVAWGMRMEWSTVAWRPFLWCSTWLGRCSAPAIRCVPVLDPRRQKCLTYAQNRYVKDCLISSYKVCNVKT